MGLAPHNDALTGAPHLAVISPVPHDHGADLETLQATIGQQLARTGGSHVLVLAGTVDNHLRPEDSATGQGLVLDD